MKDNDFLFEPISINLEDINIKFTFGSLLINILYINAGIVPKHIPEHYHSKKSYEFHYTLNGNGTCISNSVSYDLQKGIIYMTGPGIKHEQLSSSITPMSEFCICFEIIEDLGCFSSNNDFELIKNSLLKNFFWLGFDNFNIETLCKQIAWELKFKYIGYQITIKNLIEQLLISLARNYLNGQKSIDSFVTKNLDDRRLAIIEDRFFSKYKTLTLASLSDALGLSSRQTQRYIKTFYGTSFTEQLMLRKLTVAAYLLTQTDKKISDIANETGFSSLEQFCTCFKKKYGVTATDYKSLKKCRFI